MSPPDWVGATAIVLLVIVVLLHAFQPELDALIARICARRRTRRRMSTDTFGQRRKR